MYVHKSSHISLHHYFGHFLAGQPNNFVLDCHGSNSSKMLVTFYDHLCLI